MPNFNLSKGIKYSYGHEEQGIVCFRCGECCNKYRVRVSLVEARRIADYLGLEFEVWLDKYINKNSPWKNSFIIRNYNGVCVFLKPEESSLATMCLIHDIKPSACVDWTPSLNRKECRQGLSKYWGITVNTSGNLEGLATDITAFYDFLRSIN